jgi:hypothetical protein
MRFKPNYRIERAERDCAKKARKDEKLKRQQDRAAQRITMARNRRRRDPKHPQGVATATSGLRRSGSGA